MGKPITIIHDDREKKPWTPKYFGPDFKVEIKRLKVGDYTIKGLEKMICIERKMNWEEIALNIGTRPNLINFKKELVAMQQFPIRFLLINDDFSSLPGMKRHSNHVTPVTVANWILKIEMEYGISVITLGPRHSSVAKHMTREIFKRVYNHNKGTPLFYHNVK